MQTCNVKLAAVFLLTLGGGLGPSWAADTPKLPPLTTVSGNPRLPGKFVWADLVTDDVPAAQNFYGRLFGWRFRSLGNYAIAENGDRPMAGLFQMARPKDRPEATPRWFGYISVSNVERAERVVRDQGGRTAAAPRSMPKRGEQAVFADPEGALFGVIKSSSGDPEDFRAEPGDWIWIQLFSRDARKAAEFYAKVAGYDIRANTSPSGLSDYVLVSSGYARATVRTIRKGPEKVRPTWLPFVCVNSARDCVNRVRELGGKVVVAPDPQLLEGKVAVVADPTGAEVGIMEWPDGQKEG